MDHRIAFFAGALFALAGCGGNVNIGSGGNAGAGGEGGAGASATTGTPGGTTSTSLDDFASCSGPGQCVLAVPGCCDPCSVPTLNDYVAVNQADLDAFKQAVCPEPTPCPACATQINPNLFAYCDAGKCVAANVPEHPVSTCTGPDDCRLRVGTGCCEPCFVDSSSQLTAISFSADPSLAQLVCPPDQGCPECAPNYPPDAAPFCGSDGHCSVALADGP